MKRIFAIAFMAFSAVAIASAQDQGAIRDPQKIVEQVIRNWTTSAYRHRSTRIRWR